MNPYQNLDQKAFWAPAVGKRDMLEISELWSPKFPIKPSSKVATFGSCFAQHFSKALTKNGFRWNNTEPTPDGLSDENALLYNYGVFTCRTGNIYTTSLLLQWTKWALGKEKPPAEYWEKDGRIYDPFRPRVEPNGFASVDEMIASREMCIEAFKAAIVDSKIFVFTLGLTESWVNKSGGYEYPMCPGTVAGDFDEKEHIFVNQDYKLIHKNLTDALKLMKEANRALRFLLTVSPVPLTATMSGQHVLVATMQSKSILRAVAGDVASKRRNIDYFPSYEIISSFPFRGEFFAQNLRSVEQRGVDHVMANFFAGLGIDVEKIKADKAERTQRAAKRKEEANELVCEEELLAAFGDKK